MARKSRILVLALALLACGCLSKQPGTNYSTHVVVYQAPGPGDQDALANFDYIIGLPATCDALRPDNIARFLAYIDIWICAYPDSATHAGADWQAGPCAEGDPETRVYWSDTRYSYGYVIDSDEHVDRQIERFKRWARRVYELHPQAAGLFLDDFADERSWWPASEATKRQIWGDDYDAPAGRNRLRRMITEVERWATKITYDARGRDGLVVVNGPSRRLPSTKRFAEGVGRGRETWVRLESSDPNEPRRFLAGDFLQFYLLDAGGQLDTHGQAELTRGAKLIIKHDGVGSLGLTYGELPDVGGGKNQLPHGPWSDPAIWPLRYERRLGGNR